MLPVLAIKCHCHVKVTKCDIVVSVDKPYLGSSPDGPVGDDTVVEVKYPYIARNILITLQTVPHLKQHGTELKLDPKHDYLFIQIMLQCLDDFCKNIFKPIHLKKHVYKDL